MNVEFIAPNPYERARPLLDKVLHNGTDQIAIACAFLTGGGVELLKRHADRLRLAHSFIVVAWEYPTSLEVLNELHAIIPGKVYVHLGKLTPVERGVGSGLMHSKVFFTKAGRLCWLWTGSHNLTASAAQGVNCEAAVLIEGTIDEPAFVDAIAHLNQCRADAILFDPLNPPARPLARTDPCNPCRVSHSAEKHAVVCSLTACDHGLRQGDASSSGGVVVFV